MSNKFCEVCSVQIPEDFQNLLCSDCYTKQVNEIDQRKKDEEADSGRITQKEELNASTRQIDPTQGILDPDYKTNEQAEDKEQWIANIMQFQKTGILLWHPSKAVYNFIKDYQREKVINNPQYPKFIWKPSIVDVGCGIGVGSNILSQEADFVWGIDKNRNSIKFAQEAFTRIKNEIYYCPQLTFDRIDIMEDTREFQKFDQVVAIEIIEHVENATGFIETLIKKFTKRKKGNAHIDNPTEFFFSSPNRNNKRISKVKPGNRFHVREWTAQEFVALFKTYFEEVKIYHVTKEYKVELCNEDTSQTPIMVKCSLPKI